MTRLTICVILHAIFSFFFCLGFEKGIFGISMQAMQMSTPAKKTSESESANWKMRLAKKQMLGRALQIFSQKGLLCTFLGEKGHYICPLSRSKSVPARGNFDMCKMTVPGNKLRGSTPSACSIWNPSRKRAYLPGATSQ